MSFLAMTGFHLGTANLPSFGLLGGLVVVDPVFNPIAKICVATSLVAPAPQATIAVMPTHVRVVSATRVSSEIHALTEISAVGEAMPPSSFTMKACVVGVAVECSLAGPELKAHVVTSPYVVRTAMIGGTDATSNVIRPDVEVETSVLSPSATVKVDKSGTC